MGSFAGCAEWLKKGLPKIIFGSALVTIIGWLVNSPRGQHLLHLEVNKPVFGNCHLEPASSVSVKMLQSYENQGINYGKQQQFDLALREFKQAAQESPNYLGIHANIGAIYLAQKKYEDAYQAFQTERKSIYCLNSIKNDQELAKFAYMADSDDQSLDKDTEASGRDFRKKLNKAEDVVHYNLACLRSKEGDSQGALQEINSAAKDGLLSKDLFNQDPDLSKIRNSNSKEFQEAVHGSLLK